MRYITLSCVAFSLLLSACGQHGQTLNPIPTGAIAPHTVTPNDIVPCRFSITSNFNGTAIPSGRTIWFSAVAKAKGLGSSPVTVYVTHASVSFTANGNPYTIALPNSAITFAPSATSATVSYNPTAGWTETVPSTLGGNILVDAGQYAVTNDLPGGIKNVTLSGSFDASSSGVSLDWAWSAATYSQFNSDNAQVGVKPVDSNTASQYKTSDHAGTPENEKANVVGGATGGGGSNYTGGLSGTASASICGPTLLYVASGNSSAIKVYDEQGNLQPLPGSFPDVYYPAPIMYDPNNHLLYVGNSNNRDTITVYDTNGNAQALPQGAFPYLGDPSGIAYDSSNGLLYVTNYQLLNGDYGGVTVYDESGNHRTLPAGSFAGAHQTTAVAYDPNNGYLYVVNYSTGFGQQALVNAYDQNGNLQTLSGSFTGLSQSGPSGILFNPSNGLLYLPEPNQSAILVYDQNGNQQTLSAAAWSGINGPTGMAYDPHNGLIYVTNAFNNSITAYDNNGNRQTLSGSFPDLSNPAGIAVVPPATGMSQTLMLKSHHRIP